MNLYAIKRLAQSASDKGWHLLIVGGFVRDTVLGVESKDVDCEVYGVSSVAELIEWLSELGEVYAVGASFGVLKLNLCGIDLDVSLPRRENKQGRGHKGFIVSPDPSMSPTEAAARRDFTMNAMAYDPLTEEMLDFFGGRRDLHSGTLRHASDAFSEDPLRVLRGMQFCGRFSLVAAWTTARLCNALLPEYPTLPAERVWCEWEKWAEKSTNPSMGLRFLDHCGWIEIYPELHNLMGCKQDEHDAGKPSTSGFNQEKQKITSYGHDKAGGPLAASFLQSIGAPIHIAERVVPLVENHMRHINYYTGTQPCARHARRLAQNLSPATVEEWALVVEADHDARPPLPGGLPEAAAELLRIADELAVKAQAPQSPLMGRHLIEMGMRPGKHFGLILNKAHEAFIEGEFATVDEGKAWVASLP